jgi:hypothetical protein
MSTSYRVSDVDDREEKKSVHIKHECRIQSFATRRVDKHKNDLNVDQKTAHQVRNFFDVEFLSVVLIRFHLESATHFDIFELDESLLVVRAEFSRINRFEIFFQNAFEMIDVDH